MSNCELGCTMLGRHVEVIRKQRKLEVRPFGHEVPRELQKVGPQIEDRKSSPGAAPVVGRRSRDTIFPSPTSLRPKRFKRNPYLSGNGG